ncbi:ABC transporter permease [Brevibacterium casei]|uniref:Peptide/nickel transport system permease protein n=1 Tax=Brevibacterium casei CIP 102111 TaxID=1255625 RepID=A0A2H1KCE1_9MICO|nr:ABC transporter permease [Brevibacterium casei]NJE65298.1 ABC transporter permease [Brevibacterium sp. LS14]MCT2183100.1 ABC transporter permease [Brevibacterium casei]QPR37875.1 ABC transporter permease [Brevibacterium casei]QPR45167.1 ABC transporter permease [Brevibacterium casei]SMX97214.1 peptide/nickel transport system permease protein [Brevibacterium casei CIP 102111]
MRLRFIVSRILGALVVLLLIAAACFAIFYLMPTNPAQLSCGKPCSPERLAEVERYLGVDQAWWKQLVDFLAGIIGGRTFGEGTTAIHCNAPCFGYSFRLRDSVTALILDRLPVTLSLTLGAAVLWAIGGIAAGLLAALKRGTFTDSAVMGAAITGISAPTYLLGLLGVLLFGFVLNVLPIGGYVPLTENPALWAFHLILPWVVLAIANGAIYARLTRGQMLDVLSQDYIRTARAKGLSETVVVGKHGLRNLVVPLTTLFAIDIGGLLGGAVITEKVFALGGVGTLLLESVASLDIQVIVGVTLFAAAVVIIANLIADLSYSVLDPRIGAAR